MPLFNIVVIAGCYKGGQSMSFMLNTTFGGTTIFIIVLVQWLICILKLKICVVGCRALILFVAAGAIQEALAALREAQQPDTAAMFILACREIHTQFITNLGGSEDETNDSVVDLPGLSPGNDYVIAVGEYFGEYQRKLVHLCMDAQPFSD